MRVKPVKTSRIEASQITLKARYPVASAEILQYAKAVDAPRSQQAAEILEAIHRHGCELFILTSLLGLGILGVRSDTKKLRIQQITAHTR